MEELKSPDKIVQQMTRDGVIEVNKSTSGAEHIRTPEQQAAKKKMVRKANRKIYDTSQQKPEMSRLRFTDTERETPPNEKLQHIITSPGRGAALAVHREVGKYEDDNSGVQAAHFSEKAAESAARKIGDVHSRLKFEPEQQTLKTDEKTVKTNADMAQKRDSQIKPENKNAGMSQKTAQKNKIKQDYAGAFRQGDFEGVKKTTGKAKNTAKKADDITNDTAKFAEKHWKGLIVFGVFGFLFIVILCGGSSCTEIISGAFSAIMGTSYIASDDDILGAEADYTALETQLAAQIDNIPNDYPGYDEYNYYLDEIGHDPYELASYLTAKYNAYTREGVQAELAAVLAQQYTLTLTAVTEIRYRTEYRTYYYYDGDGNLQSYTYPVQVPYYYYILNVTLVNNGVDSVAQTNLTPEQYKMYLVYMETKGNRSDLFS